MPTYLSATSVLLVGVTMTPRVPAWALRRHAAFTVLAAAVLAGVGLASPAAASPSITPISLPQITITPSDQLRTVGEHVHVLIKGVNGDGTPLGGSFTLVWTGPDGFAASHPAANYAGGADVSVRATIAGTQTVSVTYSPSGFGAKLVRTATYTAKYGNASALATVGPTTTSSKTPVTLGVTVPQGTAGAGGTAYVTVKPSGPSASCAPTAITLTALACVATLPVGIPAGSYTLGVSYSGSPLYMDYSNTLSAPTPLVVTASTGGSGSSGSSSSSKSPKSSSGPSGGVSPSASASSAPTPSISPTSSDSAIPFAIAADPTSHDSGSGTDSLALVIATVGACAALAALGVAVSLLIKRRRTPASTAPPE